MWVITAKEIEITPGGLGLTPVSALEVGSPFGLVGLCSGVGYVHFPWRTPGWSPRAYTPRALAMFWEALRRGPHVRLSLQFPLEVRLGCVSLPLSETARAYRIGGQWCRHTSNNRSNGACRPAPDLSLLYIHTLPRKESPTLGRSLPSSTMCVSPKSAEPRRSSLRIAKSYVLSTFALTKGR